MVTIDSTVLGYALGFREKYFGWNVAHGSSDGCDRNLTKIFQHGIVERQLYFPGDDN